VSLYHKRDGWSGRRNAQRVLGGEHSDVATSLNDLAGLYYNQDQYEKAEPLWERALAIREKAPLR
jgi:hypothetical protein